MEPESPSPHPQVPATCPYPEPTPSSPHDPLHIPEDPIGIKIIKIINLFSIRLRDYLFCWHIALLSSSTYVDDWLTVHRSITLVDLQRDAQNSYLFTYNTFIKILYMFRALLCSSSRGLHRNCIYAAYGDTRGCIYTITT